MDLATAQRTLRRGDLDGLPQKIAMLAEGLAASERVEAMGEDSVPSEFARQNNSQNIKPHLELPHRLFMLATATLAYSLACTTPVAQESKPGTTASKGTSQTLPRTAGETTTGTLEEKSSNIVVTPGPPREETIGAAIEYFLRFKKDETRTQIEKTLGDTGKCSFSEDTMILLCPVAGLKPITKASFMLFGGKLHSVRLKFAAVTSWENFVAYETQMRELIAGAGPLKAGELTLYTLNDAKERLQRPLKSLPGLFVMFQGDGLAARGRLSGRVMSFKYGDKKAYGFELIWLPRGE